MVSPEFRSMVSPEFYFAGTSQEFSMVSPEFRTSMVSPEFRTEFREYGVPGISRGILHPEVAMSMDVENSLPGIVHTPGQPLAQNLCLEVGQVSFPPGGLPSEFGMLTP